MKNVEILTFSSCLCQIVGFCPERSNYFEGRFANSSACNGAAVGSLGSSKTTLWSLFRHLIWPVFNNVVNWPNRFNVRLVYLVIMFFYKWVALNGNSITPLWYLWPFRRQNFKFGRKFCFEPPIFQVRKINISNLIEFRQTTLKYFQSVLSVCIYLTSSPFWSEALEVGLRQLKIRKKISSSAASEWLTSTSIAKFYSWSGRPLGLNYKVRISGFRTHTQQVLSSFWMGYSGCLLTLK